MTAAKPYGFYEELLKTAPKQSVSKKNIVHEVDNSADEDASKPPLHICHMTALWRYSTLALDPNTGILEPYNLGPGFYGDSVALLLAVHHFNNGNGSVVKEIEGINERCNVRLSVDMNDSMSSLSHSVKTVADAINSEIPGETPCAVVGSFRSAVSQAVAVLAEAYGLPQISPISSSPELDNQVRYPLFSRIVPSDYGTARVMLKVLQENADVTHLGVIYVNDAYGKAYNDAIQRSALQIGVKVESFPFDFHVHDDAQQIREAVGHLAETKFKYFIGVIFGPEHYDIMMEEAYDKGIAGPGYFWVFGGGVQRYLQNIKYPKGSKLDIASRGIGMIQADGGMEGMPGYDRFLNELRNLDAADINYFNSKQPQGIDDYYFQGHADFFKTFEPERETAFAYDTIIALGLAACKFDSEQGFTGTQILKALRTESFTGASGLVRMDPETTSRDPFSALYVIFNTEAKEDLSGMVTFKTNPSIIMSPTTDGFEAIPSHPFIFSDGTQNWPDPLPPIEEDFDFVFRELRFTGCVMSIICLLSSIFFASWTYRNRNHRVVKGSQPMFLYLICFGAAIFGSTSLPASIDDEYFSKEACDRACMIQPWLYSVGFVIVFSALYSKTFVINKIYEHTSFRRLVITAKDVWQPFALMLFTNILVMVIWTIVAPVHWHREYDDASLDEFGRLNSSYGACNLNGGTTTLLFMMLVFVVHVVSLTVANIQSYKARKVAVEFNENRYITILFASLLQIWITGVPVYVIARELPKTMYLVKVMFVFLPAMAILLLIFVPKMKVVNKSRAKEIEKVTESRVSRQRFFPERKKYMSESSPASDETERPKRPRGNGGFGFVQHYGDFVVDNPVIVPFSDASAYNEASQAYVESETQSDDDLRGLKVIRNPIEEENIRLKNELKRMGERLGSLNEMIEDTEKHDSKISDSSPGGDTRRTDASPDGVADT